MEPARRAFPMHSMTSLPEVMEDHSPSTSHDETQDLAAQNSALIVENPLSAPREIDESKIMEDNYRRSQVAPITIEPMNMGASSSSSAIIPRTQIIGESSASKISPNFRYEEVDPTKDVTHSEEGFVGVDFISHNGGNLAIKSGDYDRKGTLLCNKILANLGVVVPKCVVPTDENEIRELQRLTKKPSSGNFIIMEKVKGTTFSTLEPGHIEAILSKDSPFFNELGRVFIYDHLLSVRPDRISDFMINLGNVMVHENGHLVAIDNDTDFLRGTGQSLIQLEKLNRAYFFQHLRSFMGQTVISLETPIVSRFIKGTVEGMDQLISTFTERQGDQIVISPEKINDFIGLCEIDENDRGTITQSLTARIGRMIEFYNSDSYYEIKNLVRSSGSNDDSNCCTIL